MWRAAFRFPLVLAMCLAAGCSDNGGTKPNDTNDGDNYTLEETATIGTAGGAIETDDFSLSVPAGAFDAEHDLSLYASAEVRPFGDASVTKAYRLEGLPDNFAQPLELRIKADESLSGDLAVGVGAEMTVAGTDSMEVVHGLVAAQASGGDIVCTIEAPPAAGADGGAGALRPAGTASGHRYYTGVKGYSSFVRSDRFVIWYPGSYPAHVDILVPFLEDGYDGIVDLVGLSFPGFSFRVPLQVILYAPTHGVNVRAYFRHDSHGAWPLLYVHPLALDTPNLPQMRIQIGSQLLSIAQGLYYFLATSHEAEPTPNWFHWAVRNWSEEVFTDDPAYTMPPGLSANATAGFNGLQAGAGTSLISEQRHANGMSPMIRYLMRDSGFGRSGMQAVYMYIGLGNSSLRALMANLPAAQEVWWPGFFRKYIVGDLYPIGADLFKNMERASWDIQGPEDPPAEFFSSDASVGTYPDLSAKVFSVGLTSYAFAAEDVITFTATSPTIDPTHFTVMAFAWKPGAIQYIGHARVLQIGDIPTLTGSGYTDLLAVVINSDGVYPYADANDIDLRIELAAATPIRRVAVYAALYGRYTDVFSDSPQSNREYEASYFTGSIEADVTQVGENTFSGQWDYTDGAGSHEGSITVVLDETRDTVTSVTVHKHDSDPAHNSQAELNFSAHGIGRYSDYYQVSGDGIVAANQVSINSVLQFGTLTRTFHYALEFPDNRMWVKLYSD